MSVFKGMKREIESEIFTGSMADISFLLIIYFMVTSVFSATRGLDFALPDDDRETPEIKQEDSIDVFVQPGGDIMLDGNLMPADQIDEQLLKYIADTLKDNPKKPVILRTDPEATYGNMIFVFDILRTPVEDGGIKIETISIPTQREMQNIWTMLGIAQ
ncbi:MAG: biopolymer transporter ExbD [Thermoanaerobaculales bacterium]|nr:biopolymer transporter ExbD [Thermoanaerobaculales bacterium]